MDTDQNSFDPFKQKSLLDFFTKFEKPCAKSGKVNTQPGQTSDGSKKRKKDPVPEDSRFHQKLSKLTKTNEFDEEDTRIQLSEYKTDKFKHPLPMNKLSNADLQETDDLHDLSFSGMDYSESTRASLFQSENSIVPRGEDNYLPTSQENSINFNEASNFSAPSPLSKLPSKNTFKVSSSPVLSRQTLDIISSLRQEVGKSKFRPALGFLDGLIKTPSQNSSPMSRTAASMHGNMTSYSPLKSPLKILQEARSPHLLNQILRPRTPSPSLASSISLKDRYQDLILPEREFILPMEYKKLLMIFESLDFMINVFMLQKRPIFLQDVLANIENTYKSKITHKQIAQIMFVNPKAYDLFWEKNEKMKKEYQLYITFPGENVDKELRGAPKSAKLEERKKDFRLKLIEITKRHHQEFLQTLPVEEQQKDYEGMKAWHNLFKVHEVPPIEEASLPSKPQIYTVQSVEEFLRQGDTKNQAAEETFPMSTEGFNSKDQAAHPKTISLSTLDFQGTTLSDKLIEMIKQKENGLNNDSVKESLRNKKIEKNARNVPVLKKIAEIIYIHYVQRDVTTMFLTNVVDHVISSNRAHILSKDVVADYVNYIIDLCPKWLSKKENQKGTLLLMNKSIGLTEIYSLIDG